MAGTDWTMKIIYKEEPKEWRKAVLLPAVGLAVICSIMRWRRHVAVTTWGTILAFLVLLTVCACLWPRAFRGWYRISQWLGYYSSLWVGRVVLMLFFLLVITPAGLVLRALGKDLLQLRRPEGATHWRTAKECNPLDRMF